MEFREGFSMSFRFHHVHIICKELGARGYSFFMPPTDTPDLRIAFFRGPEDIVIELVQVPQKVR
jgi:hypothetical protein